MFVLAHLIPSRRCTDPSPGPRRLVKAPVAVHPLPKGEGNVLIAMHVIPADLSRVEAGKDHALDRTLAAAARGHSRLHRGASRRRPMRLGYIGEAYLFAAPVCRCTRLNAYPTAGALLFLGLSQLPNPDISEPDRMVVVLQFQRQLVWGLLVRLMIAIGQTD